MEAHSLLDCHKCLALLYRCLRLLASTMYKLRAWSCSSFMSLNAIPLQSTPCTSRRTDQKFSSWVLVQNQLSKPPCSYSTSPLLSHKVALFDPLPPEHAKMIPWTPELILRGPTHQVLRLLSFKVAWNELVAAQHVSMNIAVTKKVWRLGVYSRPIRRKH
jgi:hypothetical protein